MKEQELIEVYEQKICELMLAIDALSTVRDYEGLRKKHYANMDWLSSHIMTNTYYDYMFQHFIKFDRLIDPDLSKTEQDCLKESESGKGTGWIT